MTDHKKHAANVFRIESDAIAAMGLRLDEQFNKAVELIKNCKGRVIVSGMGKSGLIGKKIAATFNSTGIASFFLHPAEAMHGDLGLIQAEDVLLTISKSGLLGESELLITTAKRLMATVIALVGNMTSDLADRADIVLDCSVEKEACPNNLVPTSSSTAALVMGDALAVALLMDRNFTQEDFAQLHPGGSIGLRLLKRVSDFHHTGDNLPLIKPTASMKEMLIIMSSKLLGCVLMTDDSGHCTGIFTDGDLRRILEKNEDFFKITASDAMIKNPKTISQDAILDAALGMMEKHSITQLPTVDKDNKLIGVIHLHDILKSKLV